MRRSPLFAASVAATIWISATIPIVPIFRPGPYALATTIVFTATVVAALLPSLRTAKVDHRQRYALNEEQVVFAQTERETGPINGVTRGILPTALHHPNSRL